MKRIIVILCTTALLSAGCGQTRKKQTMETLMDTEFVDESANKSIDNEHDNNTINEQNLTIDTFSTFPPEIDGCSCYFSEDSIEFENEQYIFMYDLWQVSFVKINGVLTKFTRIDDGNDEVHFSDFKTKFKNDNYEIEIEFNAVVGEGYESSLIIGRIKLTNRKGTTITKTMYGLCGC
ncbi:MAG: hypothetical protein LBQ22_04685 [Bacteroidales bacterium]|jgi:hypothetical protein|nr:hypothetical protein [Bacteroidales bacterium]